MEPLGCNPVKFRDLFKNFFRIPRSQRDFVWGPDEVTLLLEDIDEFETEVDGDCYFIGSIVVYLQDGKFTLIDGQQRLTTLYLTLICLSHYFYDEESVDKPTKKLIQSQLEAQVQTKDQIQDDLRLSLQTEGNRQVLEEIKQGRVLDIKIAGKTNSQKNILKAYKTIEKWINRKGISDARLFYLKLNGEVNLIQITAASPEHARKIFQTINARGLGLDAIDIVKDILYQRTVQDLSESYRLFDKLEKMK